MLMICSACNSKIRVPDSAAGKRVKCPKCATVLTVPVAEKPAEPTPSEPEDTGVSAAPPPPPPEQEPDKTKVTSAGPKPPTVKPARSKSSDDDDDDYDGFAPPGGRRFDEGEDDLDVRHSGRPPTDGMATASMVLGIASIVLGFSCLCCGMIGAGLAILCGGLALLFGYLGKVPGSERTAMTGLICGGVGLALGLLGLIVSILAIAFQFQMMNNMNQFGPPG